MKKFLIVVLIFAVIVAIGNFFASYLIGSAVTTAVNAFGPSITGTKLTLESAMLSPLSGTGTLTNLQVGNPPGWKSPKAFSVGKIHVDAEPVSLFKKYIVVNKIVIDSPEFVYETRFVTSNIKELLANIENATGAAPKPGEEPLVPKEGKVIKFAVKSFRLENAKATLGIGPTAITIPLPPIVITDLGTAEGGITTDQLASKVLGAVLRQIAKSSAEAASQYGAAAAGAARDAATNAASETTKKAGEGLKNIFGGKKD